MQKNTYKLYDAILRQFSLYVHYPVFVQAEYTI